MDKDLLLQRIKGLAAERGLSDREIARRAGFEGAIRNIRKGSEPGLGKIEAIARALGTTVGYLLGETNQIGVDTSGQSVTISMQGELTPASLRVAFIIGEVQAGHWLETIRWDDEDWWPISMPSDPEYDRCKKFGLISRGPSMNSVFPDGTVLVCVNFIELGRGPESGERVIVYRTRRDGLVEATCKEYVETEDGRRQLWPRSEHRDYQQPIEIVPTPEIEDVRIDALVIGSYRPEKPIKRRAR